MRNTLAVLLAAAMYFFPNLQAKGFVDDLRRTPVVKAVENTKSAVVSISTHEKVYERENPFSSRQRDPFFDRFFEDFMEDRYRMKESVRTHLGSGVIIEERGYVLTNWHVIEKASAISVTTNDDKEYKAVLVGADRKSDLAVLKIESSETFKPVPLGDSDSILIGETVIAIGNPFGFSHTVTTGVVSALHRSIRENDQLYEDFIQTDASINPGNSGGPLLNINGELVGINTAIYGEAQGIGFAIPVNTARRIVDDLVRYGEVRPAWIGLTVKGLTRHAAGQLGYTGPHGVIADEVITGSPAALGGLADGDIIVSIGDKKVKSPSIYKRLLGLYTADAAIKIEFYRKGSIRQATVKASEMPPGQVESIIAKNFGFEMMDNSGSTARRYGLASDEGIVVSRIAQNGQAGSKGLRPGDIILQMQGREIKNSADFKHQLPQHLSGNSIVLLVQRGRYGYYVSFDL
ncbi:MAG: Do family serine endopeptidase [Deltaproteobacteria bacterium]|nr:Do family serine endopeptidase [Deltaproteobacteria bacterium]